MDSRTIEGVFDDATLTIAGIRLAQGRQILLTDKCILPQLEALFWEDPAGAKDIMAGDRHRDAEELITLAHDKSDLDARIAMAMLLYYAATHGRQPRFHADDDEDEYEEAEERARNETFKTLRSYLNHLPPQELTDEGACRWELQAAGAARDGRRVFQVCRQLCAQSADAGMLELACSSLFFSLNRRGDDLVPQQFAIIDDPDERYLWRVALLVRALGVLAPTLTSALRQETVVGAGDGEVHEALATLCSWIDILRSKEPALKPTMQLVRGWCLYELASVRRDSSIYIEAAEQLREADLAQVPLAGEFLLGAIAACELLANRADRAERTLAERAEIAQDKSRAFRQLAQCYHRQGKLKESVLALETSIRERADEPDDTWLESLALEAGLQAADQSRISRTLSRAALRAKIRPQAELLVSWMNPSYEKFCEPARCDWWAGLFMLSSLENLAGLGEALCLRSAAERFGEALNHELKHRVFEPFLVQRAPLVDQARRQEYQWNDRDVLLGKGTLGSHIYVLLAKGNSPLVKGLSEWLIQNRPRLQSYLATTRDRRLIEKVHEARNRGAHGGEIARADLRQHYEICSRLMDVLTQEGPTQLPSVAG